MTRRGGAARRGEARRPMMPVRWEEEGGTLLRLLAHHVGWAPPAQLDHGWPHLESPTLRTQSITVLTRAQWD